MKKQDPALWARLEQVIRATHHTTNSFAKHIGLLRGENLYQIKRGNNGISLDVAQKIHELHPEYTISWLMCGQIESGVLPGEESQIVRIPVCRDIWAEKLPPKEISDKQLILSTSAANGAQIAIPYTDDILNPYLRQSLMLLRECSPEDIVFGNIYFIITSRIRLFRIINNDEHNPDNIQLKTLLPSVFSDLSVPRTEIISLWTVCGAICRMER